MYASVNGVRMYYERHGEGDPVVMIHDRASTGEVWRAVVPPVSQRHDVIVYDSRGTGKSEYGPAGAAYTTGLLAADLVGLLDVLGVPQACLMGISMGGGVAQQAVLDYPDRVSSLVLVSTSPGFSSSTRLRMLGEAERIERGGIDETLVAAMLGRWFTPAFAAAQPQAVDRVRRGVLAYSPAVLAARSRANAERDFTGRLARIRCPVLFVAGAEDPMGPASHAAVYAAALPHVEIRIIAGSSHLLPVQAPRDLAAAVLDFIATHSPPAGLSLRVAAPSPEVR
jgi:pimeloyl-ACP methyl ester carboxylesterase